MAGDYQVRFSGQVYRGADPEIVQAQMAQLFGQPVEKIAALFTGETFIIKQDLARDEAERYQVQLAKIGARCDVVGLGENTDVPGARKDPGLHTHGDISVAMMICPKCGHQQLEAEFCSRCGANIEQGHKELRLRAKEDGQIEREIAALRRQSIEREVAGREQAAGSAAQTDAASLAETETEAEAEAVAEAEAPAAPPPASAAPRLHRPAQLAVGARDPAEWLVGIGGGARVTQLLVDLVLFDLAVSCSLVGMLLWQGSALDAETLLAAGLALVADPLGNPLLAAAGFGGALLLVLLCWLLLGGSPGTRLVGARLLDAGTAEPPAAWKVLLRLPLLLLAVLPAGLGLFWAFWQPRRRAWHDLGSGTIVARLD